jgi:pimeloyl-ACP methyl ester carboxylesterase
VNVITGGALDGSVPIISAAHPADTYDERAVKLLQETSGAAVVCLTPAAPTLETMVDEIEQLRRDRKLPPWIFWGISGGGWLGQIYARRYPRAVRGVILESIYACFRLRLADPSCILSPFHPKWRDILDGRGLIDPHSHDAVGDTAATEWIPIEGIGYVWRRIGGPALFVSPFPVTDAIKRVTAQWWAFDSRPWLREIRTPTLVMCGDSDPIAPMSHSRALQEGIAGSQFAVFENAGHSPVMARLPDLAEVVRQFIRVLM